MLTSKLFNLSKYMILPFIASILAAIDYSIKGTPLFHYFPYFGALLSFLAIVTVERVYVYRHAVSQKHLIWRDMSSTMVQTFLVAGVFGAIILPVLHYYPNSFLGRRILFGLSDELGPIWVQIPMILVLQSLWHYWMHRLEHTSDFLWKLHGYHHSVTHLQVSNVLVSNPFEWGLRNVLGGLIMSIIGFNPIAFTVAAIFQQVGGGFGGHCGGDVKGGWLNYIYMTPEVHRWHHTTDFPDDKKWRYGCNFGVEFSFWDILFGTFLLPKDENGDVIPANVGHPSGYPDEPNYLKILLGARAFPMIDRLFDKKEKGMTAMPAE